MDTSLKRIVAFVIDILLVTCVTTIITKWLPVDPYKEKYEATYEEYMELVDVLKEDGSKYEDKIVELNYNLYKYRVVSSAISIGALILYFGIIQMILKGQTVGKKVMNLQVVSNSDKKLNIFNYLIRVIILNNVIFTVISMVAVYVVSGKNFYYVTYVVSLLQSMVYMVNILMVVMKKNNRGLHDILAGTKVIDLNPMDENAGEEVIEEKVTIKEKSEAIDNKRNKSKKKK